jgi:hypothetical protein
LRPNPKAEVASVGAQTWAIVPTFDLLEDSSVGLSTGANCLPEHSVLRVAKKLSIERSIIEAIARAAHAALAVMSGKLY